MIFSVARIVAFCSRAFTLEPGDVIATGTPSGRAGLSRSARAPPRRRRDDHRDRGHRPAHEPLPRGRAVDSIGLDTGGTVHGASDARRIETERLVLRPWRADAVWHRVIVTERDRPPDDPRLRGRHRAASPHGGARLGLYVIEVRAESDIGYCGLIVGRATPEEPELPTRSVRRAQGNGYATRHRERWWRPRRALAGVRLWATVGQWNAPSLRILIACARPPPISRRGLAGRSPGPRRPRRT